MRPRTSPTPSRATTRSVGVFVCLMSTWISASGSRPLSMATLASPSTRTAKSTSLVVRGSTRALTAKPPSSANLRPSSWRSRTTPRSAASRPSRRLPMELHDKVALRIAMSGALVQPGEHALIQLLVAPLRVLPAQPGTHHPLGQMGELERVLEAARLLITGQTSSPRRCLRR